MHCDKHVVKMVLEATQMLYAAHKSTNDAPVCRSTGHKGYKPAHPNHPMTKWVQMSKPNYVFTCNLASSLASEYTYRYKKTHACEEHIRWLSSNVPQGLTGGSFTQPPLCMPDEYKDDDVVVAYRSYYIGDKQRFAVWKYTDKPDWWITS